MAPTSPLYGGRQWLLERGATMRKPFDDLLDEINEIRRNVATSNDTRLEPRVARLEHIVQRILLALVEEPEDDAVVEIMPHKKTL
jgi:hypothetical protein